MSERRRRRRSLRGGVALISLGWSGDKKEGAGSGRGKNIHLLWMGCLGMSLLSLSSQIQVIGTFLRINPGWNFICINGIPKTQVKILIFFSVVNVCSGNPA